MKFLNLESEKVETLVDFTNRHINIDFDKLMSLPIIKGTHKLKELATHFYTDINAFALCVHVHLNTNAPEDITTTEVLRIQGEFIKATISVEERKTQYPFVPIYMQGKTNAMESVLRDLGNHTNKYNFLNMIIYINNEPVLTLVKG